MVQVATEHYDPSNYDELHRWVSYWYQFQAVASCQPKTMLEIGKGGGVLSWYLRERLGLDVVTVDFDASLEPDVVADVRALRDHFDADQFDLVCAFQVLEHLPYDDFQPALRELRRVSKRDILISLPNWGYFLAVRLHIWKLKLAFGRKVRRPFEWQFDGEHYWEVGTKGHQPKTVRAAIEEVVPLVDETVYPDYPYHRSYHLRAGGA